MTDAETRRQVAHFYDQTLKLVRSATTVGQRADALAGARANALWDMLTDAQRAQIEKAGR